MTDDADELEQAEAEALARALEDKAGLERTPEDALEAAALLRYSGREGELAPERAEAVLKGLLPKVEQSKVRPVRLLAWTGGLAAAAAALLFFSTNRAPEAELTSIPLAPAAAPVPAGSAPPRSIPSLLPAPTATLLAAQAGAAQSKNARAQAQLEAEMRQYRQALLRALENRYPAQLGILDVRGRP